MKRHIGEEIDSMTTDAGAAISEQKVIIEALEAKISGIAA
jgi:hypothetical protein